MLNAEQAADEEIARRYAAGRAEYGTTYGNTSFPSVDQSGMDMAQIADILSALNRSGSFPGLMSAFGSTGSFGGERGYGDDRFPYPNIESTGSLATYDVDGHRRAVRAVRADLKRHENNVFPDLTATTRSAMGGREYSAEKKYEARQALRNTPRTRDTEDLETIDPLYDSLEKLASIEV